MKGAAMRVCGRVCVCVCGRVCVGGCRNHRWKKKKKKKKKKKTPDLIDAPADLVVQNERHEQALDVLNRHVEHVGEVGDVDSCVGLDLLHQHVRPNRAADVGQVSRHKRVWDVD